MENASREDRGNVSYPKGIPYNVTLHAWPIPRPNETTTVFMKSNESAKNYTITFHNINATGYIADDDLTDTGFTDVQTFILASLATILPLLITVATIMGARHIWKRYRARMEEGYKGVLQRDESSDPSGKLQGYSLCQDLKTSESQITVSPIEEQTADSSPPQLLTPKSNGSVITMTLKNNHLIVETEETDGNTPMGVKIESKGTSTKFVTSMAPDFKIHKSIEPDLSGLPHALNNPPSSTALVHSSAIEKEEEKDHADASSCNTGFSQSDLSESSEESQNPSYRYGNQTGYNSGGYGYFEYMGYHKAETNSTGAKNQLNDCRKLIMKEQSDSEGNIEAKSFLNDVLVSDIQAREKILYEKAEKRSEQDEMLQNNGISLVGDEAQNEQNKDTSEGIIENGTISQSAIKGSLHEQQVRASELS